MEEKAEKVAVMDHQTEAPPPPAPEPPRGKRRYWTAEEKAAILAETYQPGVTVVAIARKHGLSQEFRSSSSKRKA